MGAPLRVLIAEDSENDTLLLVRELKRAGYDLTYERVDDKAGTGYTLSATTPASGVTGMTSATFTITPSTATHLVFTVQPSNTAADAAITPAVEVSVRDAFENTVTTFAGSVTVAIETNADGGGTVLSGTKIRPLSSGVATFNDLSINHTGVGYTLNALSGALPKAVSSGFNIF